MTSRQKHDLAMKYGEPRRSAKLQKKIRKERRWTEKHGKPMHGRAA